MSKLKEWCDEIAERTGGEGEDPHHLFWGDAERPRQVYGLVLEQLRAESSEWGTIFEVGCGYGWFYEALLSSGLACKNYVGIDRAVQAVEKCRHKFRGSRVARFWPGDWQQFSVLGHDERDDDWVSGLVAVVAPGTIVLMEREERMRMLEWACSVADVVVVDGPPSSLYKGRIPGVKFGELIDDLNASGLVESHGLSVNYSYERMTDYATLRLVRAP